MSFYYLEKSYIKKKNKTIKPNDVLLCHGFFKIKLIQFSSFIYTYSASNK